MKILFALNHPAHYYLFKHIIISLRKNGHSIEIVIKEKDILEQSLIAENIGYTKISQKRKVKSKYSILIKGIVELFQRDIKLFKFLKKLKPNIMLGTDIAICHVGKLLSIPSLVYNEDDFEINKYFCKLSYSFATNIVAPENTSVGKYIDKKISYNGIQKMAYLGSDYFTPNRDILDSLNLKENDPFIVIRLVSLTAGHDIEGDHTGLSESILNRLIPVLLKRAKVFITGEDNLPPSLIKYKLTIPVNKMHDLLAFASLFIGDSQSMCAEAGILGTPFIRFNDFVGKIEYLNDLENKYKLGWGVNTDESEQLIPLSMKVLDDINIKEKWKEKRKRLFLDKVDLVRFSVWLIEKYPDSMKTLIKNPEFQNNYKYLY